MTLIEVLKNIDGAATARRVGTDALSPTFAKLLPMAFPNAELVDGELAMRAARRIKTADEVARAARAPCAVAEDGLAAAVAELRAGSHRTGADRRAARGDGGRWGQHVGHPGRRMGDVARTPVAAGPQRRPHRRGRPGGLRRGRAGRRLRRRGGPHLARGRRARAPTRFTSARMHLWDRLVAACRPGQPASDLLAAYEAAGEPLPPMPVAHGLGLGFDPPVVSPDLRTTSAEERLDPGMVLAVTGYVWAGGRRRGVRPRGRARHRPTGPRC